MLPPQTKRLIPSTLATTLLVAIPLSIPLRATAAPRAPLGPTVQDETLLISRAEGVGGTDGNGNSSRASVSADGRYVVFYTLSTNIHPLDTDTLADVYVRDVQTDELILVSRASGANGVKGNDPSRIGLPRTISADGRYVAFHSRATNLHPEDTDSIEDVFVRDVLEHETILVSRANGVDGVKGNATSYTPLISADGRYVLFTSQATNLHPDDADSVEDLFLRDLQTNETFLVSRASGAEGAKANANSQISAISDDGRLIAFFSQATNLHPDDPDGIRDVFVRDLQTHETTLVSRAGGATGVKGNGISWYPALSADGRTVAFRSVSTNLHPDDPDNLWDVFVRDLTTDELILVSRARGSGGVKGDNHSHSSAQSLSADGRYVTFQSAATNLHPDDSDTTNDAYVRDLRTQEIVLASRATGPDGAKGNGHSSVPSPSADGRYVVFESRATNLAPGDADSLLDVFSRDVLGPPGQPELGFDPPGIDFGDVMVGATSAPQVVTLHNTGDADAAGLAFGDPAEDFDADTEACGDLLPTGADCEISLTFTPAAPGPHEAILTVTAGSDASAELILSGQGVPASAGFTAMGLSVDPSSLVSDGNDILEPGELVEVAPAWRNDDGAPQGLSGAASGYTGPEGAVYSLSLEAADYGEPGAGETASCLGTGVCYQAGLNDPAARPATHWEASFEETLSDDTTKAWSLHIGDSFADVPRESPFYPAVETLLHHDVTGGCTETEYCPAGRNTRGQMAVFLLKAVEDGDYTPPACAADGERFIDVPFDSPLCPWIEELATRGVTAGCGGGRYCPGDSVTRAQMAVFLLKAFEGTGYTPPGCSGEFSDVDCSSVFADWIEELAERGVTGGCRAEPLAYCPAAPVTRAQMAVFVTKTFGLELYAP